jgi:hypothetical protein
VLDLYPDMISAPAAPQAASVIGGELRRGMRFWHVSDVCGVLALTCDRLARPPEGGALKVVAGPLLCAPLDCYLDEREALTEGLARLENHARFVRQQIMALESVIATAEARRRELDAADAMPCPFGANGIREADSEGGEE